MYFSVAFCVLGLFLGVQSVSYEYFYRKTQFKDDTEWGESIYARSVRLIRQLWTLRDDVKGGENVFAQEGLKMVKTEKIDDLLKTMDGWWMLRGKAAVKDTFAMSQSFAETGLKRICDEVKNYVPLQFRDCGNYVKVRCCYPYPFQSLHDDGLVSYINSQKDPLRIQIAKSLEDAKAEEIQKNSRVITRKVDASN
ncbi:uncharacterized protein LOC141857835 [Brevipalpus obovatus]|uniref:uncharacterized protein LOC141857835 n=1 Tax=Brevipalpus obovatus TaxID=246614 RepID=UPI003D9E292D